jgi:hypothetical protein
MIDHPGNAPFNADRLAALAFTQRADWVAMALAQGHVVRRCRRCHGPVVLSRIRPFGQCLRCGAVERSSETVARKRMKCYRCSRFFRSVTRFLNCPDCRESLARRAKKNTRENARKNAPKTASRASIEELCG